MQNAEIVLSILGNKALSDESFVFERLYRNLFNKELYYYTQRNISKSKSVESFKNGTIAPAADKVIIQTNLGEHSNLIEKTIDVLGKEQFYPGKDKEMDVLVESILIKILDAIYKPVTLNMLDEGMPYKNIHDSLSILKNSFKNVSWTGFGQLKSLKICEKDRILVTILSKRINDGRFIELIRRYINYVRLSKLVSSYSDSHLMIGSRLIKALENIYLSEIDKCFSNQMKVRHDLRYIRCFGDFIFGTSGNKLSIIEIKESLQGQMMSYLGIDIEKANIRIANINTNRAVFLEHEVYKNDSGIIELLIPEKVIAENLKPFVKNANAVHCAKRINLQIIDIIKEYNKDLQKFYEYYNMSTNFTSRMRKFQYYHYLSLAKTISLKEKSSVKKTFQKYGIDIRTIGKTGVKRVIGVRKPEFSIESLVYYNRFFILK